MRFKPGQKVVCVKKGEWRSSVYKKPLSSFPGYTAPKFGDIVTVVCYSTQFADSIFIVEHPPVSFRDYNFEPLMDISELTEILEQQPATV